ncbi:MAG: thiamine pyrophosphate-binding protein [Gemmatimonadota bacterium]|jgi:sulfopyruvate decarboxylase alpha subunit
MTTESTAAPVAGPGSPEDWPAAIHRALSHGGVRLVSYVPDAGHKRLIELCQADNAMRTVPLTTEEEGIGLAMGAWLGGERSVLLLQSSGVGNLVNVLGGARECRSPLVMIATMRGEYGEFNPWQVPMGRATPAVLKEMGAVVERVVEPSAVGPAVEAALRLAYRSYAAVAVLIAQRLVGIKSFQEQVDR